MKSFKDLEAFDSHLFGKALILDAISWVQREMTETKTLHYLNLQMGAKRNVK